MSPIDLGVIVVYILGCTALGAWLGARGTGLKGYFLGESNIPAWAVMISIVATETSTVTFLSVPGHAYEQDFRFLQLALGLIAGRLVVAAVLLPSYFRGQIYTAYQILQGRFGGPTRTTASILFLVARSLGDGLRLFLAATMLRQLTGWNIAASIVVVGTVTVVYTYLGGMKAVIWTDVIQFSVYILGAIAALFILEGKLPGGWSRLIETADAAGKFRLFDFSFDLTRDYTFWSGLIGGMVLNTATHGADQLMVQRYLAARSQRQAAGALIVSGFVVLAQFALFLFIGVSLWVFYREVPPASTLKHDEVFAYFIANYLPVGVKGLVIAAIFSAAMGTLAGSLNSSASSIVNDLYRPLRSQADERHLVRLGKALTAVWGVVLMAVALGATHLQESIVKYALTIASFVTGILLGVFLLGILTRRVGQNAALTGMLAGIAAVSYARFGTSLAYPWLALVGSSTVFGVGLAASYVMAGSAAFRVPDAEIV